MRSYSRSSDLKGLIFVASAKSSSGTTGPRLAWRGDDPVAFSRVLAALKDAEIPSYQIPGYDHLMRVGTISKPRYGIFVRQEDASRAEEIVREALEVPGGESIQ